MPFKYFNPDITLSAYIQCYWELTGADAAFDTLHPDGCIDVIVNTGDPFTVHQKNITLEAGGIYLGGALTAAIHEAVPPGVRLLGIRFIPGCFGYFYPPSSLGDIRDNCIPVDDSYVPGLNLLKQSPVAALDAFYKKRLRTFDNPALKSLSSIIACGGNTTLKEIAAACNRSKRQTERTFKKLVGLSPKQFCHVAKYIRTQQLLKGKSDGETLLGIALEAGYYDHAHLTKSFKKIALRTPGGK
ncbi:helix-turn-helix domain-containing protein [Chitinophaga solisilvae]|uniref:helix-turn-helix domain-containing protein n=1 Tax=Chitinophaga solisilvae TaxID=1233460 RepID=UPI00136B9EA4|nr:AraC family transcriptional regulator [Chitinophaga solisilvae]